MAVLYFIEVLCQVLVGARTEIAVFIFAVCAHILLFGKQQVSSVQSKETSSCDAAKGESVKQRSIGLGKTGEVGQEDQQFLTQMKQMASSARLDDALSMFQAYPRKSVYLYNTIIDAFVMAGKMEVATQLMMEATDLGVADVVTHNVLLKAHLHNGDLASARKAVDTIRAAGIAPNCVTFNELLDATIKSNPKDMWGIINDMRACGCMPNSVTCSTLLKGITAASDPRDLDRALEITRDIKEEIDEVLFGSMIEACIRSQRLDLLAKTLKRQKQKRIALTDAHSFGSVIRGYGQIRDLHGAREAWSDMKARNIVPTSVTFGCMVEALVSNGDIESAYDLVREAMHDEQVRPVVNAVIYCSVLKGFSHNNKFERVWDVYQEMRASNMELTVATYNALVDACARCGELGRMEPLLKDMVEQGIEPNVITHSTVLKGYCQQGRLEKAFELMEQMKKTAKVRPDEVSYNTLLDGCARRGLYERGMAILEEMHEAGVKPTNFTLAVLVKLANRSNRLPQAFELCEAMQKRYGFKPNVHVYNNLMQACIAHRKTQRALEVFEKMVWEKVRPDVRSYTLLLRACVAAEMFQDCAGLLRAGCGLRGAHPRVARFETNSLRPQAGLPTDLISETLAGIACEGCDEQLAVQLFRDLRKLPGLKLDQRVPGFLAAAAKGLS